MINSLIIWVYGFFENHWDTIWDVIKVISSLFVANLALIKVVYKGLQKWSFGLVICLNLLVVCIPLGILLLSTEPITRFDIAFIAFYVFCLMSVIFMCLIKWARDKTVYQAKLKYDLFYTGDIDVPDIEVIPQKKNRTEP